jgi:uncharacterized protein (DUF488 family)
VSKVWTVGHGTLSSDRFVEVVRGAGIAAVGDVRRYPGSRRHPHFGREQMHGWLGDAGIGYRWFEGLGGRRRPLPDSLNVGLTNEQFRGYADHMASAEFADALADLLDMAGTAPTAVLCSETVWWRCHRRLLADHLVLVEAADVEHVFHEGRVTAHRPTPGARRDGGTVVYDALPAIDAE